MKRTTKPHRRLRSFGAALGVCVALSAPLTAVATPAAPPGSTEEGPTDTTSDTEHEPGTGSPVDAPPNEGPAILEGPTIPEGPAPEQSRDVSASVGNSYFQPGYFDTRTLVDQETGEVLEVTSGITRWEESAPSTPFARTLVSLATASVKDVLKVSVSPNTGTVSGTNIPKMRIDLDIPTGAKSGDTYTLTLNLPWVYSAAMSQGVEVKDAHGTVFALVKSVRVAGDGGPNRFGAVQVILTDAVETHADIKGFAEFKLAYWLKNTQQTGPIIVTGDGTEMARTGNWTVPAELAQTPSVSANGGFFADGSPQIQPYIRLDAGRIPQAGWTISLSKLAAGLSNSCVGYIEYRGAGEAGFIVDRAQKVEAKTCTDEIGVFVVSRDVLDSIGASGDVLVTFRSPLIGKLPATFYTATLSSSVRLRAAENVTAWIVGATTGVPPTVGADSLFLNTTKSAAFTTSNGNAKPTLGDTVTYTITTTPGASNNRAVTDLMTVDTLPAGLQFVSASGGGTYDPSTNKVTWGPRILTSTGAFTDTVTTKITGLPQSRSLVNTVSNAAGTVCADGDSLSTCEASVTTPVGNPDFTFRKSSTIEDTNKNGWLGDEGDTIVYSFVVGNTGDVALTSALLTDGLLNISGVDCLPGGSVLKPGESQACQGSFTHSITAADVSKGSVTNHATMCVDPQFGLACKPGETTNPTVSPSFEFDKEIESIKTPAGSIVKAGDASSGDIIRYRFVATNTGNVNIAKLTVSDEMLGVSGVDCLPAGQLLKPAESFTCTHNTDYDYTITRTDAEIGTVHNVAIGSVPGLPDDSGETTTPITPNPVDVELPNTGGSGTWLFVGLGAGLLATGLAVMVPRVRTSPTPKKS